MGAVSDHLSDFKNRSANRAISISWTKLFVSDGCLRSATVTSTFSYNNNKDGTYKILNPQRAIMELRLFGAYLDRKALLENELFKLSESVRSLERYSKSSTTD